MSELKAFYVGLGRYCKDGSPCVVAFAADRSPRVLNNKKVYLKSEADKVIAHQKYNRCLLRSVIAEMNAIHFKDLFYGEGSESLADEYNKQITIHYKWQIRWLALAEKFKEAK